MNEIPFEVCTFFKSSMSATAPVTLKALPTNFPSLSSCKVKSRENSFSNRVLLAFTYQRAQQGNKGMAENQAKSLASKHLHQIEKRCRKMGLPACVYSHNLETYQEFSTAILLNFSSKVRGTPSKLVGFRFRGIAMKQKNSIEGLKQNERLLRSSDIAVKGS